MLKPVIVIPYGDHVKLLTRASPSIIMAEPALGELIVQLHDTDAPIPGSLSDLLRQRLGVDVPGMSGGDAFVVRSKSQYAYGVASWELNLLCNYNCPHCYLGVRPNSSISVEQRRHVIDRIVELGVMRLQITGGEPLIDAHFEDTYREAYDRGVVITISTNGSWLFRTRIQELFLQRPPMRITVSMYGATESSYEAMTKTPNGSFKRFLKGLQAAADMGIELRINIIVSTFNQEEIGEMKQLAARYTDDFHVFDQMNATILGGDEPLMFQVDDLWRKKTLKEKDSFDRCGAGVESFHVDPHGNATMCKIGRDTKIDLTHEPASAMARLASSAQLKLVRSGDCTSCTSQSACVTCPVIVEQYRSAQAEATTYCRQAYSRR